MPIRLAGSIIGLVDGVLAAFVETYQSAPHELCSAGRLCSFPGGSAGPTDTWLQGALFAVGAILALVSLVSFTGLRLTFILDALLSAAMLAAVALTWGAYAPDGTVAVAALSIFALVANAVASRSSKELSEKDSPLNLPVFG